VSAAPVTLEGWYVLHEMYAVDWPRWNGLGGADRDAVVAEATALLERQAAPRDGHSGSWTLLTHKGDLCLMHWRRDLEALRGEQVHWYDLPPAARAELMRGHGEIGRRYAGRVTQVIAGSVGLDDWEWGVTLFADDPLVFKKLVHEMRFDPASSRYALFGPFYVGIRFAAAKLGEVLRTGVAGAD